MLRTTYLYKITWKKVMGYGHEEHKVMESVTDYLVCGDSMSAIHFYIKKGESGRGEYGKDWMIVHVELVGEPLFLEDM